MLGFVPVVPVTALLSVVGYLGHLVGYFGIDAPHGPAPAVASQEQVRLRGVPGQVLGASGADEGVRLFPAAYIPGGAPPTYPELQKLDEEQADLFQRIAPSVACIGTEYTSMAAQMKLDPAGAKGVGSGFVWDKKGHIVTNFHVINKVDKAIIGLTLADGTQKQYTAKLTGVDPDKDIAVLKIDAAESDLQVIPVGDNTKTRVGQLSYAVGNPFGQDDTLTTGVISGRNRVITAPTGKQISGVIQTDAAINPGNSGGPLLNSMGKLIGINTAALGSGVSAGVGFAVPIDAARPSIEQIIETGRVEIPILGISILERTPTPEESAKEGLPLVREGVIVEAVPAGSPAEASGLKALQKAATAPGGKASLGDVIVAINDEKVKEKPDIAAILGKYKPGQTVDLTVLRGPEQAKVTLKLKLATYQAASFSKLENERGAGFSAADGTLEIPFGRR